MTSLTNMKIIHSLTHISELLNRYLSPAIFSFGIVGNILNCFVLYRKPFRSNPCALLFLVSSLFGLISIFCGLVTRILAGWHLDPTAQFSAMCKLRAFIVFSTRTMSLWLITLATIDRWLLSSNSFQYRRMSNLKGVKFGTIMCFILSMISYAHMLYCYEAKLVDGPLPCYGATVACRLATDLIYIFISVTIPLTLMIIFGVMTILNVNRARMRAPRIVHRLHENHTMKRRRFKTRRIDHRLLFMLLVQVSTLTLCCIPQAVEKLYITFHPFNDSNELRDAMKTFLYNIALLLAFIQNGVPFYIYTLVGGSIFRQAFIDLIRTTNIRRLPRYLNHNEHERNVS